MKSITKKAFDKFNKEVETILLNAGATLLIKNEHRTEFSLPTYYGKDASFALHTEFMRGDKVFSIYGNTNHYDSNINKLFNTFNTKININTYDEPSALSQLSDTIKKLQTNPNL